MVRSFPQILYDIIPYVPYFFPVKFSSEYFFDKQYFQLPQNVKGPINNAEISTSTDIKWGKIGP